MDSHSTDSSNAADLPCDVTMKIALIGDSCIILQFVIYNI